VDWRVGPQLQRGRRAGSKGEGESFKCGKGGGEVVSGQVMSADKKFKLGKS